MRLRCGTEHQAAFQGYILAVKVWLAGRRIIILAVTVWPTDRRIIIRIYHDVRSPECQSFNTSSQNI